MVVTYCKRNKNWSKVKTRAMTEDDFDSEDEKIKKL